MAQEKFRIAPPEQKQRGKGTGKLYQRTLAVPVTQHFADSSGRQRCVQPDLFQLVFQRNLGGKLFDGGSDGGTQRLHISQQVLVFRQSAFLK